MKLKWRYAGTVFFILALVIIFADDSIAQCSMCRKIATDGNNTKTVGASLNMGILYLLAIPYVLVGFFFRKQIFNFVRGLIKR